MSWLLLLSLAGLVFFNRYLFLEPRVPVRLPAPLRQALNYSAPCLLTAICGPIILLQDGMLRSLPDNPYLLGAVVGVVIAAWVRNMILSVLLILLAFYLLCWLL